MPTKLLNKNIYHGFTLIEVLVVISVISLLGSIVIASTNIAKAKGRDARKQADTHSVEVALNGYYNDKGTVPSMYDCTSTCTPASSRTTFELEDLTNPTSPTTEAGLAYNRSMQDLVDAGYIKSIPHAPAGSVTGYGYFDAGSTASGGAGAMFYARLETTNAKHSMSCRNKTSNSQSYYSCAPSNFDPNWYSCITYPFASCATLTKPSYSYSYDGTWYIGTCSSPPQFHYTSNPPECNHTKKDACVCTPY